MYPRLNPNHIGQMLARLTSQFQTQPNIRAWVAAIGAEVQALENAAWSVFTGMSLANAPVQVPPAINAVFDILGSYVGQGREGLFDLDYKTFIYLRVAVNRATGQIRDWSNFGAILLRAGAAAIGYWADQSATLFAATGLPLNGALVAQVLSRAVPNGQRGVFSWSDDVAANLFCMGSVYDSTAGTQGYGSVYDTTAGGGYSAGAFIGQGG